MNELVLVTGASGFVGRAMCEYLPTLGYRVRAATRSADLDVQNVAIIQPAYNMNDIRAALDGVTHVVHCAGLAHAERVYPEGDFLQANAFFARDMAIAAAANIPGRFVMLSSVSAVSGPYSAEVISAKTAPRPQNAYGRSKLLGERLVRAAFENSDRYTILRPTLVYGSMAKASILRLFRLSALPFPLPFAGMTEPRSLLDLDSLVDSVSHVLKSPQTNGRSFLVCDSSTVSLAKIIASFRRGLGRPEHLFSVPRSVLGSVFTALGRTDEWTRVSRPLVVDSSELRATGWVAREDTADRLTQLAAAIAGHSDAMRNGGLSLFRRAASQ